MSRQDFATDWVPFRDPRLTAYPELKEADLQDADGSTARLAERIAERRGIPAGEAQQGLHEFLSGPMPAMVSQSTAMRPGMTVSTGWGVKVRVIPRGRPVVPEEYKRSAPAASSEMGVAGCAA